MSLQMGPEYCTRCNAELEEGQIGLCDDCQDAGRTRIGNTPTCETCGEAECVCGDKEDFGNEQRAAGARVAVWAFANHCGELGEGKDLLRQNIVDLLADLAHLCDREDLNLASLWESAASHYLAETENTGEQMDTIPSNYGEPEPVALKATGLKEQLGAAFPWLTTDEDDQISGADTIDQLQQFYDNLDDAPIGLSGRDERKDFQK